MADLLLFPLERRAGHVRKLAFGYVFQRATQRSAERLIISRLRRTQETLIQLGFDQELIERQLRAFEEAVRQDIRRQWHRASSSPESAS